MRPFSQLLDFSGFRARTARRFTHPFWAHVRRYRRRYVLGLISLVAVDAINVALPLVVREAIDALPQRALHKILWAGVAYGVLMAVQAWGRYLWRVYLIGTSHLISQDLRLDLYRHLQRLPLGYYQEIRTGDLMSRATNDIESIRQAVGPGILVTMDAAFIFICIIPVMFWLSWKLTLIAFAFYPLVPWLTARLGDRIDNIFESMQAKMSQLSAYTQESFAGIRLIKSLVLESRVAARFRKLSHDYMLEGVQAAKYQAGFSPALSLLTNLGTFLILMVGGREVLTGALTVGTFVAFQRFVVQLSWPMEAIGWAVTMSREGAAAQRRLSQILRIPEVEQIRGEAASAVEGAPLLEIRNLSHSHAREGGAGFRLRAESLKVEPGRKIGIVGPVGSGKSTLFQLILRLHEPPLGTIFWRGRDVASLPLGSIRSSIASVEQQVFLFSESIQENIFMGAGDGNRAESARDLTQVACVWEELEELPSGLSTPLGERGVNLSGGQKQRVALARALAREPELLLLDDAFSAVDVEVENRIIANFFQRFPDLALLFASHRLSVMPRMDEIWLMEAGRITDRGTHEELLKTSSLYQQLWQKSEMETLLERFELVEETAMPGEVTP